MTKQKIFICLVVLSLICFGIFVISYENHYRQQSQLEIDSHSRVVASSVWTLFTPVTEQYLSLSVRTNNYKKFVIVSLDNLELFSYLGALEGVDRLLDSLGLIGVNEVSSPVVYKGMPIGEIRVQIYNKNIYLYGNILIVTALFFAVIWFVMILNDERKNLQYRVAEKTQELASNNQQLQLEILERIALEKEQLQTERNLRISRENLRATLDSIGDAVIATDADCRVTRMNPVAEKLTGWPIDKAAGLPLQDVFQIINAETQAKVINPVERVMETGEVVGFSQHTQLLAIDGREFRIADSAAPIKDIGGKTIGVVLVFRDVSEQHKLEERLRQSEKMRAIGELAGGVAHDFNNMLGGILGSAELLDRLLPDDPKMKKFIGMIMDSAERAAELTAKLLAFARKQPVSLGPVDVHQILENTLSLLKNTVDRRVKINTDFAATVSTVNGDLSQLQSAFLNLCINGVHSMPDGGELSLASELVELDDTDCQASPFSIKPGSYLQVEVSDKGCGIAPEILPRIFEPFFTTKNMGAGTGLGLAAVFGTMQQHHGAVSVYSEVGYGTRFRVLLPLVDAQPQQLSSKKNVPGSGRILVVDDEAVMRTTAQAILEGLGYQVSLAGNGKEGLALLAKDPKAFDLVLLDMIMPEMNGRDCFAEMKKISPDIRVLLSSGFTHEEDLKQMQAAGLSGYIRKPYRTAMLSQAVAEALKKEFSA